MCDDGEGEMVERWADMMVELCDRHAVSLSSTKCEWLLMEWMHKFESNGFRGGARSLICLPCRCGYSLLKLGSGQCLVRCRETRAISLSPCVSGRHRTILPAAPLWFTRHHHCHHHHRPDTTDSFAQSCGRQLEQMD